MGGPNEPSVSDGCGDPPQEMAALGVVQPIKKAFRVSAVAFYAAKNQ